MYYSLYRRKHIIHRTKKKKKNRVEESKRDNKRNRSIHIIDEQLVQFVVDSEVDLVVVAVAVVTVVVVDLDY